MRGSLPLLLALRLLGVALGLPPPALQARLGGLARGRRSPSLAMCAPQPAPPPPPSPSPSPEPAETSMGELLRFCVPTLAIWLASPVLSMIDTSVVGLRSSVELAALSPAVQLCDSSLYMFSFLAVAATNLLAPAGGAHSNETEQVLARASSVALACGTALLCFVQTLGPRVLHLTAGTHAPEIVVPAITFARVRSLGSPLSLLDSVLKTGCLAYRDVRTPMLSTLASSLCNAVGDWYFVMGAGWGIFGAGLATALSELVSSGILLRSVYLKNRAFNAQRNVLASMFVVPSLRQLAEFWTFAGPICLAMIGKTVTYSACTSFATSCGVLPLAAHQVMLRLFFFFTCFGDALSQTVQTFLPGIAAGSRTQSGMSPPVLRFLGKILFLSLALGQLLSGVARWAPAALPSLFSRDPLVWAQMLALRPFLSAALRFHVVAIGLEGALLAMRDLDFLARTYVLNTAVTLGLLSALARRSGRISIRGVWSVLVLFQVLRAGEFAGRLLQLLLRDRAAPRPATDSSIKRL